MSGGSLKPDAPLRLVVVQGPLQAVAAVAGITADPQPRDPELRNVLVIGGLFASHGQGLETATRTCAAGVQWEQMATVAGDDISALELPAGDVGEVWCARNWQTLNRRVLDAFPRARRVTYGDGIGVVDTDRSPEAPQFDVARLVLPQPELPGVLDGQAIELVPLEHLRDAIATARAAAIGLEEADARIAQFARGGVLALLGNLTEAGLTTRASEVRQARRLVESLAARGAPVVLKPHPRASMGQAAALARQLRADGHPVRIMVPDQYGLYPIELFRDLVLAVGAIQPGLSSSTVSLAWLYGVRASAELPPKLARTTLFPDAWNRSLGIMEHHRRALREMDAHDGRTPLAEPQGLEPGPAQRLAAAVARRILGYVPRPAAGDPPDAAAAERAVSAARRQASAGSGAVRLAVRPPTHLPGWRVPLERLLARRHRPGAAVTAEYLEESLEAVADVTSRSDARGETRLRYITRR